MATKIDAAEWRRGWAACDEDIRRYWERGYVVCVPPDMSESWRLGFAARILASAEALHG